MDGIHKTVTESSLRRNFKLKDEEGISSLLDMEIFENLTLMGYNISPNQKRTKIAQSFVPPTIADESASPLRDVSQGEACPTDSGFIADQDRATIAKSSTLPHDSASRVTSPAADEGSMQQTIFELTALYTSLQRQHSELLAKFQAQDVEINKWKERIKLLEDRERVAAIRSRDDAPIKERSMDEGEAATERIKSETPKKQKVQEQVDAQVARELEEQLEREDQRRSNLGWKVKDFRGMTFKEVEAKFNSVWKHLEDFVPIGSKEEAESSASYQFFIDLLKHLDREDLNQLWRLVKETLSNRPPTSDKEMELWVELTRLYEPDHEDQLWTHTQNFMHALIKWKLYDSCGVHHVTSKDKEIFMLVEKDYPLRKGLALVMISYKLQLENYSQMANDLILKIYKIANSPRQQGD
uniref:Uncharacterized protein n=1 Tax=Tanacetum cinerariifolium TaxID=118510 RepID=A0A6L2LMV7_TANCI|nr:hypothetical protein [Tanacetum cinerariifolium]